jgi:hypothetical protein
MPSASDRAYTHAPRALPRDQTDLYAALRQGTPRT